MSNIIKGNWPHTEWLDINNNGIVEEVLVMHRSPSGEIFFIPMKSLDRIDLQRVARVLSSRNVNMFPLPELLAQTTLGNGMNALLYFQQLVKMKAPNGTVIPMNSNVRGAPVHQAPTQAAPITSVFEAEQQPAAVTPNATMLAEAQTPRRGRATT